MANTEIIITEVYEVNNGVSTLIETIEQKITLPTVEEQIAEKEAKLLEMYAELQALKEK